MLDERAGAAPGRYPDALRRRYPRITWPAFWGTVPLALVALALLGSVAFPARQSWRIMRLLRETSDVVAPARALVEQLQTGMANERVALQSYALSGDRTLLSRYEVTAADDQRRLVLLGRLTEHFDPTAASHAHRLQAGSAGWYRANAAIIADGGSPAMFGASLQREQARYDGSVEAATDLSLELANQAEARMGQVRRLEYLSIVSNAALVLAAIIAMYGVAVLTMRERRLTTVLRRRMGEESALREAAETLGDANSVDEVTQRIAQSALEVLAGCGAFVEIIEKAVDGPPRLVVRAVAGTGVPPLGATSPLVGSNAQRAMTIDEPLLLEDLATAQYSGAVGTMVDAGGPAIVVPLGGDATPSGFLFVVRDAVRPFTPGDVIRAGVFGHLAALSYSKCRLLDESRERARVLERVIQSRSRLMRGFSHDVKNPLGAADGFAEMLAFGVYGDISDEQRASITRMRRNIDTALALIDDLHELSRAETGHLAFAREPLDLAAFMREMADEYLAAAQGHGLSLTVVADDHGPIVMTDRTRVRQIVANLLSNAIKYTEHGSVTLSSSRHASDAGGVAGPDNPDVPDGGWATIQVTDSGIGIAADKQQYIFEEFSRLGTSSATGAGLGLAISELIARGLGGHISVESEVGRGSTFTLWLPCRS